MSRFSPRMTFVVMGATSMLLQIVVLRLLLSTFSGNELDIGITLSIWLFYAGMGSFAGRKVRAKNAFAVSFILIALLALPTAIGIRAIRPLLSLAPGETVPLLYIMLSTGVALLPLCFLVGMQFPLAVSHARGENAAGRVYGLEAIGASAGGVLFTFVLSSRVPAVELCLFISILNLLIAVYLSRKKVLLAMLLIPFILYAAFDKVFVSMPWKKLELVQTSESKYGEISVVRIGDQLSVYASGHLFFSYPDLPSEEMTAHLPMSLLPSPSKILVIGGSPATIKEFLKYPISKIDFIELDPVLITISRGILDSPADVNAMRDKRVNMVADDGRRFIKRLNRKIYDLILINLPPPVSAGINRFYTVDFFREARSVLDDNGIIYISLPTSAGYMGKSMQTVNGSVLSSLKKVFRFTGVTAQEYGGVFASDSNLRYEPKLLEDRFSARGIPTRHFTPYIFTDAFDPRGVGYVEDRLGRVAALNTDIKPSAYLYNLMLWSEVHGGGWLSRILRIRVWHAILLLALLVLFSLLLVFRKRQRTVCFSIFTTGFSGMTFTVGALLAYQSAHGYVYEMIGLISALFMIGLWLGTVLIRDPEDPVRTLSRLEVLTVSLAAFSPLFFGAGPIIFVFVLLSGTVTGGLFSSANAASAGAGTAGKLYGLDLAGSFSGALVPAIVVIPLFGLYSALLLAAALKVLSAFMTGSTGPANRQAPPAA